MKKQESGTMEIEIDKLKEENKQLGQQLGEASTQVE